MIIQKYRWEQEYYATLSTLADDRDKDEFFAKYRDAKFPFVAAQEESEKVDFADFMKRQLRLGPIGISGMREHFEGD